MLQKRQCEREPFDAFSAQKALHRCLPENASFLKRTGDLTHILRRGRRLLKTAFIFYFGISHLVRYIQCLSLLKLTPAEYATNVFSSH